SELRHRSVGRIDGRAYALLGSMPGRLTYLGRPWLRYRLRTRDRLGLAALPGFTRYLQITLGLANRRALARLASRRHREVPRSRAAAPGQRFAVDVAISGVTDERHDLILRVPRYFPPVVFASEDTGAVALLETAVDDAAPARNVDRRLGATSDLRAVGRRQHRKLDDRCARRVGR